MDPFATPEQLATRLGTATQAEADAGSPDVLDTLRALDALTGASGAIRSACGWSVSVETGVVETFYAWRNYTLFVKTRHLTAVAVAVGATSLVYGTDYTWHPDGWVWLGLSTSRFARETDYAATPVTVTYSHGYPLTPDPVLDVCLELAVDRYDNPQRKYSTTRGETGDVYPRSTDPAALRKDFRLAPYVRPVVA